jgi:hypothetical protein
MNDKKKAMNAKSLIKPILPLAFLLMVFTMSCEDLLDDTSNADIREKIEGQWKCDETSSYYKTTSQIYEVYIYPHPDDSTLVVIENFYGLIDVSVVATMSNRNLYINSQTVGDNFTIIGSGTISSNYNEIEWNYSVEDGSGTVDDVTATYTKL